MVVAQTIHVEAVGIESRLGREQRRCVECAGGYASEHGGGYVERFKYVVKIGVAQIYRKAVGGVVADFAVDAQALSGARKAYAFDGVAAGAIPILAMPIFHMVSLMVTWPGLMFISAVSGCRDTLADDVCSSSGCPQ